MLALTRFRSAGHGWAKVLHCGFCMTRPPSHLPSLEETQHPGWVLDSVEPLAGAGRGACDRSSDMPWITALARVPVRSSSQSAGAWSFHDSSAHEIWSVRRCWVPKQNELTAAFCSPPGDPDGCSFHIHLTADQDFPEPLLSHFSQPGVSHSPDGFSCRSHPFL